jgi:RNase adaptor protein for sRNA GlmZ degradation
VLQILIRSFAYKHGLPPGMSQHGGGYIFDCRCIQNPGREEQFKPLTGRHPEVQKYLQDLPAADRFFSHVEGLVEESVDEYLRRGFERLEVSFGCTGGQHRSVFFAERLAKRLRERSDVQVTLQHRELDKMCAEPQ